MAAAAFWIGLAAFLIAAGYFKSRSEAHRHETLRRVIEKTGAVDEERLRELMQPPPPDFSRNPWATPPGYYYKCLRGFGLVILAAAAGIAIFFTIAGYGAAISTGDIYIGYGAASIVAMVGLGIFLSARYCDKPPGKDAARKNPV